MDARRFHTRPAEVTAIQWTGDNAEDVAQLVSGHVETFTPDEPCTDDPDATGAVLTSRHRTWELLYAGDWIVRDDQAGITVMRQPDFEARYQPAPPEPAVIARRLAKGLEPRATETGQMEWVAAIRAAADAFELTPPDPTRDRAVVLAVVAFAQTVWAGLDDDEREELAA